MSVKSCFILYGSLRTNKSLRFWQRLLATSMEQSGKKLWRNGQFLNKFKWWLLIWDTLEHLGLKVDVNITLFQKKNFLFFYTLGIEDILSNSDFTNLAEYPLATKWVMYSCDFISRSSVVEQFLPKREATLLIM